METESRLVISRTGEQGLKRCPRDDFKVEGYFRGNGNILELDSGEACTTFWMY